MEVLPTSSSPNLGPMMRRRKKRPTPVGSGIPGSSLSGLNRSSIRVVELSIGNIGYGFTISGQKPCLLRGIVEGSPADKANLRSGNCLVGVNDADVSHLEHDQVVAMIGKCPGVLKLHVADSYFSESSDEEFLQSHQPRPKYSNRVRGSSKTTLSKKSNASNSTDDMFDYPSDKLLPDKVKHKSKCLTPPRYSPNHHNHRRPTWDPIMNSPRRVPRVVVELGEESPIPELPSRKHRNIPNSSNVESVRVFSNLDSRTNIKSEMKAMKTNSALVDSTRCGQPNASSSKRTVVGFGNPSPSSHSSSSLSTTDCLSSHSGSLYQAVVGYVGSVELPAIEEAQRLQALTVCIRRLRGERRMRSVVLLRVQPNGISLFSANQNVQTGPPLAFYSSAIISFCGAYNEDRRFFGLVTCTNPRKNCSCHVFMVEPKLLSHLGHSKRARAFGIQCTALHLPKNGQVLGLQECAEFPATADPVLSSIVRLHGSEENITPAQRSPSEASTRLESTNSSNSDSGVGFRDESDRNSARIYDIIDPEELMFDVKNIRRSPVPRKKYPNSQRKGAMPPLSNCQPFCTECRDDAKALENVFDNKSQTSRSFLFSQTDTASLFQTDPLSLQEILGRDGSTSSINSEPNRKSSNRYSAIQSDFHNPTPPHIEVSVLVNSTNEPKNSHAAANISETSKISELDNGLKSPLGRNGTRSLENLCSPEIFVQPLLPCEGKANLLGSTPALNQDCVKTAEGFWEFKVPQPPKPKKEMNRVETWAESIEKLLVDNFGIHVFTEFLNHEFSAENMMFYNACIRYKEAYPNLTQCQRISMASTIFQRFLQINGASDPVNVDFKALTQVEKLLPQPTLDIFDLPLAQVYNLLKFDCYPRFLRSEMYRDYSTGALPLPQYDETSDSDQDSIKSQKLEHDGRRRSLLPWHIKNRSKNKNKSKAEADRLNSDISFIQRTAMTQNAESSDTDDGRRQSYKLCRVTLPDNSTTVLPCKPGETLSTVVQRLLEKREFHYSAFEVINVASGKALDLTQEASEMNAKEVRVEPRAFIGIELPRSWRVGVRANPFRKLAEVLKPILSQHSLKLDAVVVYDLETSEKVDMKSPMARVDGHNLLVKLKDPKLEEITNVQDMDQLEASAQDDDDLVSTKTGSSHSSSVFRGFLRRSSKKYKRKGKSTTQQQATHFLDEEPFELATPGTSISCPPPINPCIESSVTAHDENSQPNRTMKPQSLTASPLSLVSTELKLADSSRNRKPIYIAQTNASDNESNRN